MTREFSYAYGWRPNEDNMNEVLLGENRKYLPDLPKH